MKQHSNVLILSGVKSASWGGITKVTDGQSFVEKPRISVKNGVATIVFDSGRKKSKPVADAFNEASKTKFASQGGSGGAPKELNFFFDLDVELVGGGKHRIYAGQGSNAGRNNWWIGHDGLSVKGLSMRTAIGSAYDKVGKELPDPFNHVAGFLGKLFSKDLFNAVNMFELS